MLQTFSVSLSERKQLADDVYQFTFNTQGHSFEFQPGQYVILHIPQEDGKVARRLYSMASPHTQTDSFELLIEIVPEGLASQHLMKMNVGDELTVQGPAGMFTPKETDRSIVFLATGTGVAPIRSMIHWHLERAEGTDIYLFWGFKTFQAVYLFEEFKALAAQHPNFHFYNCLSREQDLSCISQDQAKEHYLLGHVNDELEKTLDKPTDSFQYYLCGGPKVVESLREWLDEKGVPKEQVHFEKFTA
ncbi:MAG: ferredoxin--NADP reductase [Patescibacteria group bacterium]